MWTLDNIRIINKANIEFSNNRLTRLITEAALPDGKLILVLSDKNLLPGKNQGACVPRKLLNFSRPYVAICGEEDINNCDVCIAISKKYCEYPAYFTYLIGHELGHAKICLSDLDLHIHYCLIQAHIKGASHNVITKYHELPHERRFDQFGIYLCEKINSRHKLNAEIETLIANPDCNNRERLNNMLSLNASNNLNNLREDLIHFSRPFKSTLIASWKKEREILGDRSLTSLIDDDYEALFK